MIGLDTNVLVRHIMQDDPKQSQKASKLIEALTAESPGFVAVTSVVELVWVLQSAYGLKREQVSQALDALLRSKQLLVDQAEHVAKALRAYGQGNADFADCLIERTAHAAGFDRTIDLPPPAVPFITRKSGAARLIDLGGR